MLPEVVPIVEYLVRSTVITFEHFRIRIEGKREKSDGIGNR